MNTRFPCQQDTGCGSRLLPVLWISFASVFALVLLGTALHFLQPARSESVATKRLPANQLQADVRTLAAAARFLMDYGNNEDAGNPVAFSDTQPTGLQPALPQFAQFGDLSNHVDILIEPTTNRPSRI